MKTLLKKEMVMVDRAIFSIYDFVVDGLDYGGFLKCLRALSRVGFSKRQKSKYRAKYEIRTRHQQFLRGNLILFFDSRTESIHITMTLKVNPTLSLRYKLLPELSRKSLDKKYNFIPQEFYDRHDRALLSKGVIEELNNIIQEIIERVSNTIRITTGRGKVIFSKPSISPQLIEFYVDVPINEATLFTSNNRDLFLSLNKMTSAKNFGTWSTNDSISGNSYALSAQPFKGEFIKIYPKDVDSVRFEVSLNKQRITSLKGKFQFGTDFICSLQKLIDLGFPKAAKKFLAFIDKCSIQPSSTQEINSLIFQFIRSIKNPSHFKSIVTKLIANGKVESIPETRHQLDKLVELGFLNKEYYGPYTIDVHNRQLLKDYWEFCKEYDLSALQNKHKTNNSRLVS